MHRYEEEAEVDDDAEVTVNDEEAQARRNFHVLLRHGLLRTVMATRSLTPHTSSIGSTAFPCILGMQ